jgi:hypothetical protein
MAVAKKKKTIKKSTKVHAKVVHHAVPAAKRGYRHSAILSDTTLMFLALFFALVGLLGVMVIKRQNDEFDILMQRQRETSELQYRPIAEPTATPVMKKTR